MWDHARFHRLLSPYHDGELPAGLASEVEAHLQSCSSCRRDYRHLAQVANFMRHLPRQDAPPSLSRVIRRRIDAEVRGMVPILREELLSSRSRPVLLPAVSLAALLMLGAITLLLMLDVSRGAVSRRFDAVWGGGVLRPIQLQVEMMSPRLRDGYVNMLPFTEVERGQEGTLLTLASIDQHGAVRALEVLYRSGDEQMLARTLEVLRSSGFEPARLGDQTVPVHFLYLFTTTEVRLPGTAKRIT